MSDQQSNEDEWSLRDEMGEPEVTSEEGAPELDKALIERFLSDKGMKPEDVERVLDHVSRFASWREEYIRVVVKEHRADTTSINPNPPEPP